MRATHDFLPLNEINELKQLILNQYFHHVLLHKYVLNHRIVGFIGTSPDNIEMLFIEPEYWGQGNGQTLMNFVLQQLKIDRVDVNEQNLQACEFYKKMGFQVIARSELDAQTKPYPILHLKHHPASA